MRLPGRRTQPRRRPHRYSVTELIADLGAEVEHLINNQENTPGLAKFVLESLQAKVDSLYTAGKIPMPCEVVLIPSDNQSEISYDVQWQTK